MHHNCFACSENHPFGLKLSFEIPEDRNDRVTGEVIIPNHFQGYDGVVHGGIVSTVLDSAMTCLLLKKGIEAYTVSLNVRFRRKLLPDTLCFVEASLQECRGSFYSLQASLIQNQQIAARAKARFIKPNSSG